MIGVNVDITERKQAEDEKMRLSDYNRLLLESTAEGHLWHRYRWPLHLHQHGRHMPDRIRHTGSDWQRHARLDPS